MVNINDFSSVVLQRALCLMCEETGFNLPTRFEISTLAHGQIKIIFLGGGGVQGIFGNLLCKF